MPIEIKTSGDFKNSLDYLNKLKTTDYAGIADIAGRDGVQNLASLTPKNSGKTASQWRYEVARTSYGYDIQYYNANVDSQGVPVALLINYGHGTGTGGYVPPKPFIDTALTPVYNKLLSRVSREVQ